MFLHGRLRMRFTTSLTTLIVAGVVAGGLTASTAGASAVGQTCLGLDATIVASDRYQVVGTEGDDVIVTKNVDSVRALGGDDTVCVSGAYFVDAGDGNDRVRSERPDRKHRVVLGSGSDLFEGSGAADRVFAENFDNDGLSYAGKGPDNTDTIRTYGGQDQVFSGDASQPNHDLVDLGRGSDYLMLAGAAGGTAQLVGGPGSDTVSSDMTLDQAYDLEAGTALVAGGASASIPDFENVVMRAVDAAVSVRGTPGRNKISITAGRVSVDAGAGRDVLNLFGQLDSVVGGPGRDHVLINGYNDYANSPVRYDLGRGLFARNDVTVPFETETLHVATRGHRREKVTVIGSSGSDRIVVGGCGSVVRGRGGADVLRSVAEQCGKVKVSLYGGAGNDRLHGSVGRDLLIGNGGFDRAVGGPGRDRCRAEIKRSCELG